MKHSNMLAAVYHSLTFYGSSKMCAIVTIPTWL